jgi:hypothetical protein
MARPNFLDQPAKLRKHDRELQKQLQAEATDRGVVPTKDSRRLDFIERSIVEIETHLRKRKISDRAMLKERLKFLRDEHARLLP